MSLERREHLVLHVSQLGLIISEGDFLLLVSRLYVFSKYSPALVSVVFHKYFLVA